MSEGPVAHSLRLLCPNCRAPLPSDDSYQCAACGASYPIIDGVPVLVAERGRAGTSGVAELYDEVAEDYDQVFASHVAEHYLTRRAALVGKLLGSGAVLDVGCGTGVLAERLLQMGYDVTGVDLAPAMLAQAKIRGVAQVFAALSSVMPFEDDSFDLAITVATLHHLETTERVASTIVEMGRVVRPGGTVVLWDHNPLNPYWPLLMSRVPQDDGSERLVGLKEILTDVRAANLRIISARRVGLVPDFMPGWLMSPWLAVEAKVEATPGLRLLTAHNVVVARKPSPTS